MKPSGRISGEAISEIFYVADVFVSPQQNLIRRAERFRALEAKTMGVLACLAENSGSVVSREKLLNSVWGELRGSDEALSRAISLCRSAFAQIGAVDPIRTIPRRGYSLIAEVVRDSHAQKRPRATLPEARALYLKGRTKAARIASPNELAQAVALLTKATQLDPAFAAGWSALAHAQALAAGHTPFGDRLSQIRLAGESATEALALDFRQPTAHTVRAQLLLAERDVIGAINAAQTALSIAPTDADATMWLGYIHALIGHFEMALPLLEAAVALDPLQGRRHMILAVTYVAEGDYDAAEQSALQSIDLGFFGGHEPYAAAAYARGDRKTAVARFDDAMADFVRVYKREPRFRTLLNFAAKGIYGESGACRQVLLSAAKPVSSLWKGSPEGILPYIFLRTGSAHAFTKSFGTRILPGNSIVLPYVFGSTDEAASIRQSEFFSEFLKDLGILNAWEVVGEPVRKWD